MNVDLVARLVGREADLLAQLAYVVHAGVACGVDLDQVEGAALGDRGADRAVVAGGVDVLRFRADAVDGLGQDARHGGLAGAAQPGEEVGVGQPVRADGVAQGAGDVLLPVDVVEGLGTPATVERLGGHGAGSSAGVARRSGRAGREGRPV